MPSGVTAANNNQVYFYYLEQGDSFSGKFSIAEKTKLYLLVKGQYW